MNFPFVGPPGVKRPHGTIKLLNFLVFQDKKNRPAPWAVKMFFFRVQPIETVFKGVWIINCFSRIWNQD
jgi:hypothetical protein